jgi:hypothetical protein
MAMLHVKLVFWCRLLRRVNENGAIRCSILVALLRAVALPLVNGNEQTHSSLPGNHCEHSLTVA